MKNTIYIDMEEKNLFFSQGMKYILEMYFNAKGIRIFFTSNVGNNKFNIMIKSSTSDQSSSNFLSITLRRKKPQGKHAYQKGIVSYYAEKEVVIKLLDELFESPENHIFSLDKTCKKSHKKITSREKEVLKEIASEKSYLEIAKKLKITTKTVSAHKNTVMRKLGFTRDREFYMWLLQQNYL
jgi:DNA-binding CsgD family transcriptional regulator